MKSRIIITAIVALFAATTAKVSAQDIIYTTDFRQIAAKVIEIGERDIVYKAYENPDGPRYRMSVQRVAKIAFENGREQYFYATTPILDYRWGSYYDHHHHRIGGQELADYIGISLYGSEYMRARNQYTWGLSLTGVGATALIISVVAGMANKELNDFSAEHGMSRSSGTEYIVGGLVGAGCIGAGIPLWVKGNRGLQKIADDYNRNFGRQGLSSQTSVTVGPTCNGFGLALNF